MVVPEGMESAPLPAITPPLQLIDAPVRLIAAVPLSVPPCMASVGMLSAEALLRVSVPPETVTALMPPMLLRTVVPPAELVAPVALYVPLTVFVPAFHCTVPALVIDDDASKLCVSFVLK